MSTSMQRALQHAVRALYTPSPRGRAPTAGVLQRLAFGQQQADLAVAAQIAGGRQHQSPRPDRPMNDSCRPPSASPRRAIPARPRVMRRRCSAPGSARRPDPWQWPARSSPRCWISNADQVVVAVHAQRGPWKALDQRAAHRRVAAGSDQRRRLTARHLLRVGAAQAPAAAGWAPPGVEFRAARGRTAATHRGLAPARNPAAQPGDRHVDLLQQFERRAQAGDRRGDDQQAWACAGLLVPACRR